MSMAAHQLLYLHHVIIRDETKSSSNPFRLCHFGHVHGPSSAIISAPCDYLRPFLVHRRNDVAWWMVRILSYGTINLVRVMSISFCLWKGARKPYVRVHLSPLSIAITMRHPSLHPQFALTRPWS